MRCIIIIFTLHCSKYQTRDCIWILCCILCVYGVRYYFRTRLSPFVCDAVEKRLCSSFAASNYCCVYSRSPRSPSSKVYLLCCSVIVVLKLSIVVAIELYIGVCVCVCVCEYGYLGTHLFPLLYYRPHYKYILRARRYARNNIKKFNNNNIIIAHYII